MKQTEAKLWLKENHKYLKKPIIFLSILSLITSLTAVFFAYFSKETIDAAVLGDEPKFFFYAIIISSILLLQIIASAVNQYARAYYVGYANKTLKQSLFSKMIHAKLSETNSYHSGELMNYLSSDVETVSDGIIDIWPKIIFYAARFSGAFVFLYLLDIWFALFFVGFGLLLFLGSRLISKPIKKRHHDLLDREAALRGYLQEHLENITVIKSFEAETQTINRLNEIQDKHFKALKRKTKVTVLTSSSMQIFFAVGYGFAIIFGAYRLMEGALTFGALTALIQLVTHIQSPFSGLSQIVPKYYQMMASSERLLMMDHLAPEVLGRKKTITKFDQLIFKSLHFSYQNKVVISGLNFTVNSKEFIKISGESGRGKTTLMKLLLGLIEPQKGMMHFVVDGQKKLISPETRNAFSYVPQGHLILSGTIRENLEYYTKVSDEKLKWACEIACILDDIKNLPLGFDTKLGEKGLGLSEGQLQRLAIARALLKDAPVLLLDEITSALDAETENKIFTGIKTLSDKTCFIISHRILKPDLIDKEIIINPE